MKFVPYTHWSQRPKGATPSTHPIGDTRGVTLHWEGPHMGPFDHGVCDDKIRGIQSFHRDVKHWADIAYNALVCPHGYVFGGRGPWTASAANGDEVQNDLFYAVCYLGGENDGFTEAGKRGFHDAVRWLRTKGGAGPEVNGHRDVRPEPTECPGDVIYQWLNSHNFNDNKEEDIMASIKDLRGVLRDELKPLKEDHDALAEAVKKLNERLNGFARAERERDKAEKARDEANHPDA